MKWIIESSSNLNLWHDKWLSAGTLRSLVEGPLAKGEDNLTVKDVIINGSWNLQMLYVPLSQDILNVIKVTTLRRISVRED